MMTQALQVAKGNILTLTLFLEEYKFYFNVKDQCSPVEEVVLVENKF